MKGVSFGISITNRSDIAEQMYKDLRLNMSVLILIAQQFRILNKHRLTWHSRLTKYFFTALKHLIAFLGADLIPVREVPLIRVN